MTDESLEDFIDRTNRDPDSVRREWEAKWREEHDDEWWEANEPFFDAQWAVLLEMHGEVLH